MTTSITNDTTRLLNARLLRVAALDNDAYSTGLISQYCDLVDETIDVLGYGHSLFRVSPYELRASKAIIFLFKDGKKITSGLHMASDPDERFTWINGVVKGNCQSSAEVRELLASSIVAYNNMSLKNIPFRACYRIFPTGFMDQFGKPQKQNKGSAKLFLDFDFSPVGVDKVEIQGSYQDIHLVDSCDHGSNSFRVTKVESSSFTVHMAREYLNLIRRDEGTA